MGGLILENFDDSKTKKLSFKKSEVILHSQQETKFVYEINQGLVKVHSGNKGRENIAVIYGSGDFFPLAWIIDEERPPLTFSALTDCSITLVQLGFFQDAIKEKADLYKIFMRRVVEQFAIVASALNNLGLKYGRERLAYGLIVFAHRFGQISNNSAEIPYINQDELSTTLNMTRESVSLEFTKLEKSGIVEARRPKIIIKDLAKLQKEIDNDVPILIFGNSVSLP